MLTAAEQIFRIDSYMSEVSEGRSYIHYIASVHTNPEILDDQFCNLTYLPEDQLHEILYYAGSFHIPDQGFPDQRSASNYCSYLTQLRTILQWKYHRGYARWHVQRQELHPGT